MEKLLICDICGTAYADTEEKCPTCGYARAFEVDSFYSERPSVPHTKVRGGRYSKKNVQKRLQELAELGERELEKREEVQEPAEQVNTEEVTEEVNIPAEEIIEIPEEVTAPAEEVVETSDDAAVFEEEIVETPEEEPVLNAEENVEEEKEAEVSAEPQESVFEELDLAFPEAEQPQEEEPVQDFSDDMVIVEEEEVPQEPEKKAKGGSLWLNLALGFASIVFALSALYMVVQYAVPAVKQMLPAADPTVVATEAPTTEPTEAETEAPTEAEEALALNYTQLTFTQAEDSSKIFAIGIADQEIIWSSDDPAVASVTEAGLVTAVGPGTTTIHAVYGEQEAVVTVTCDFE